MSWRMYVKYENLRMWVRTFVGCFFFLFFTYRCIVKKVWENRRKWKMGKKMEISVYRKCSILVKQKQIINVVDINKTR